MAPRWSWRSWAPVLLSSRTHVCRISQSNGLESYVHTCACASTPPHGSSQEEFLKTEEYYNLCVKHDSVESCYHNSFFPEGGDVVHEYNKPTSEHTTDCSDGYCSCDTPAVTRLTFGMDVNYPPYAFKNATTGALE
eukprot:1707226-Amphidinium_carterae.1